MQLKLSWTLPLPQSHFKNRPAPAIRKLEGLNKWWITGEIYTRKYIHQMARSTIDKLAPRTTSHTQPRVRNRRPPQEQLAHQLKTLRREQPGSPRSPPTQRQNDGTIRLEPRLPSHSGLRHDLINHSTHSEAPCNLAGAGLADCEAYVARLESSLCVPSSEVQATSVERCISPSENLNFTDQGETRPNKRRRKSGQHQTPQASIGALIPAEEESLTSDLRAIPIRQPAPGFDDFTPALLPVGLTDYPGSSTADTMVASTHHWFDASLNLPHNMFSQSNAPNTEVLDMPVLNSDADTITRFDLEQYLALALQT
jgi:hypothetical protein